MTDSQFFGIDAHVWLAAFAVSFGRISPILPNLCVPTGGAVYGRRCVQRVLEVE